MVLHEGHVIAEGDMDKVQNDPRPRRPCLNASWVWRPASVGCITFDGTDLLKRAAEQRSGHPQQRTGQALSWTCFPCSKQMLNRRGGDLSGQQQLAIDRALVLEMKLWILDEPTEGIQPNIVHEIGEIILRLNNGGSPCYWSNRNCRSQDGWQVSSAFSTMGAGSLPVPSANKRTM